MFTQCPECQTTFRVSAKVLQQAAGRVRCGGCGNAFNGFENLSKEDAARVESELRASADDQNKKLLETLDKLAGPEVRIEDTGTEWQVLEEDEAGERESGDTSSLRFVIEGASDDEAPEEPVPRGAADSAEMRYDDDTVLPEDFGEEHDDAGPSSPDEPETMKRQAGARESGQDPSEHDEAQVDIALGEPDDWVELLDEVSEEELAAEQATQESASADQEDDSPTDISEQPGAIGESADDDTPSDIDTQFLKQAEDMGIDTGSHEIIGAEELAEPETEQQGSDEPDKAFDEDSQLVETIIMEGDTVNEAMDEESSRSAEQSGGFESRGSLADTYTLNRHRTSGGRRTEGYTVIASIVVLGLLLTGQLLHQSRQSLATLDAFNHTIGPVYRALGRPVMPEWDIRGWKFEATNGSIDESVDGDEELLTIYSRLANKSSKSLPYPLVHVSLTDRWEEIIGSRVLEPNEYLAGDLDPGKPVRPGENFTAVITIESPSADATGFKLNVCYRVAQGRVRCATEDFKN